jgi:ABC-2 type transport system permease protein
MLRSLHIALIEVKLYLQDKGDLAFSLLLPVVTFALIYGAFGGESMFEATAYVVDEDDGIYSDIFLEKLEETEGITVELITAEKANTKLERSDVLLVTYIPEDFSEALVSGEPTQLVFMQRGNAGQEGQIIASIERGIAGDINREFLVRRQVDNILRGTGISGDSIEVAVQKYLAEERTEPLVEIDNVDPTLNEEQTDDENEFLYQFLPGIVTMYVLFAVAMTARVIVEERRKGTLERLLTTRLSVGQLFFGKFLTGVARGFVQTLILLGLSYAVFQLFTPLSFLASLVIALVFTAAASAVGLVIASISRSEDGATWIAVVFSIVTFMFGGTFFEIAKGSGLYTISRFAINTYANDAYKVIIAEGGSLADVGPELGVLAIVIVAGLVISRLIFKAVPGSK